MSMHTEHWVYRVIARSSYDSPWRLPVFILEYYTIIGGRSRLWSEWNGMQQSALAPAQWFNKPRRKYYTWRGCFLSLTSVLRCLLQAKNPSGLSNVKLCTTLTMDSGLSSRTEETLKQLLPAFAAAAPPKHYNPTTAVDLSTAQNEVLRPELLEFFKSTVEDKVTSQVCSA